MANTELTTRNGTNLQRPTDMFSTMRDEMDRMFQRFESGWPSQPAVFGRGAGSDVMIPELDVHDNGKQLTIDVDLPGVNEKDVTVSMANGMLTIKGEKKSDYEEKQENYYLSERNYGAFERCLRLPETLDEDKVEARFDKGVLKITVAKKPEAIKAEKKIEINKA